MGEAQLSPEEWRRQSLRRAVSLGYPPASHVPLAIDEFVGPQAPSVILDRLVALEGPVAVSLGTDRQKATAWLSKEGVWHALTDEERSFITEGVGVPQAFEQRIEAMWALAWALGLAGRLDFASIYGAELYSITPNIEEGESSERMRSAIRPRSFDEIAQACALAYCLDWACVTAILRNRPIPGKVPAYVVAQRRQALEWVLHDCPWDDVPMDT